MNPDDQLSSAVAAVVVDLGLDPGLVPTLVRLAEESVQAEISSGTAVASAREAVDVHIADSLSVFATEWIGDVSNLIDIGSGLGFPGLAIAAVRSATTVVLLDAARKKADAAALIARRCGLANVESVWGRAEAIAVEGSAHRLRYDIATARALAPMVVIAEYAAPLLRDGGSLVAWKGAVDDKEIAAAGDACAQLGLELDEPFRVSPFPGAGERSLWRLRKVAPTPNRFPRRPGRAARSPLGA